MKGKEREKEREYVFADILQKTLEYEGYKVSRVMNITDIGHLTSDADDGEDKMVKGLLREGKSFTLEAMKELAVFYKDKFMEDLSAMNIKNSAVELRIVNFLFVWFMLFVN